MQTPGYRWWVGDLRTGLLVNQVDLTDGQWSIDITGAGTMSGSFPLRSMEWPDVDSDTAYPKASLAVSYVAEDDTETFIEAGPLIPGDFDENENLPVAGAGLLTYYDWRQALQPMAPGANPAAQTITYQGNELGLIQKRLIQLAHSHFGGAMPVVLPTDDELGGLGSAVSKVYNGSELQWIGKAIRDLSAEDNGPEFQLVPRRREDDPFRSIEWVAQIGTAATGYRLEQSGDPLFFDRRVPKSAVLGIRVAKDASRKTYRSYAPGSGDGANKLIGWAENLDQVINGGYALVESVLSATDANACLDSLESLARADVATNSRAFDIWTMRVARDGFLPDHEGPACPNVGQYRPGYRCVVSVRDHYQIKDGDYDMRILKMSGDAGPVVELQMAPIQADD